MPLSCGFSSVQEQSLLWTSQANARTGPSHPTTSRPARVLSQTTEGKCVPSSGEQPLLQTHLATLHLFWLCHPFPKTNQSRVDRKMCASKEGQSVRHDFQKACVPHFESGDIEISNRHVRRETSPCFPAHLSPSLPKHANLPARSSMMAKDLEETTTPASATGQGDDVSGDRGRDETGRAVSNRVVGPAPCSVGVCPACLPPAATHVWVDSAHPRPPRDVVRPQPAIPK